MLTLKCVLDNVRLTQRSILSTESLEMNLRILKYTFDLYEKLPEDREGWGLSYGSNRKYLFTPSNLNLFRCRKALNEFKDLYLKSIDGAFSNQRDLALCQFAFCGYIISRSHFLGIDPTSNAEDLQAFNHFWRVVGHCIGVNPKFNLCSEQISETNDRILSMTPRLIGPAFMSHSNTYVKIVLDFVEIFWYLRPIISMDSILFLSNRMAGIPGYYLTQAERIKDLQTIDDHQGYLRTFNKRKLECELYSPKCYAYVRSMWQEKMIISAVVHLFKRYSQSKKYRWILNSLVWFGRFCIRQLSFMVVRLGFQCSYANFWTMRKAVLINLRGGRRYQQLHYKMDYVDKKELLNDHSN